MYFNPFTCFFEKFNVLFKDKSAGLRSCIEEGLNKRGTSVVHAVPALCLLLSILFHSVHRGMAAKAQG